MKLGICLESTGLSFRRGLQFAAEMGVYGIQVDAVGELSPEKLTETGKRDLRNLLKTYDLQLTALNCPLRRGLDIAENQQPRLEYIQSCMQLAFELGPRMVIVQLPKVPKEDELDRGARLKDAILSLGMFGDRMGSSLAFEIGLDSAEAVRDYLNRFDIGCLGVNYDPANMLANGFDPIKSLYPLFGKVLQVHARDATTSSVSRGVAEVPLGAGDIEWMSFIGGLTAIEYRSWLVVEREQSDQRVQDVRQGVAFLKRLVV